MKDFLQGCLLRYSLFIKFVSFYFHSHIIGFLLLIGKKVSFRVQELLSNSVRYWDSRAGMYLQEIEALLNFDLGFADDLQYCSKRRTFFMKAA